MSLEDELSDRHRQFRDELVNLLVEYAPVIGPAFDGDPEGYADLEMPTPTGWLLVVDWEDIATGESFTITIHSGSRYNQRKGMALTALQMICNE